MKASIKTIAIIALLTGGLYPGKSWAQVKMNNQISSTLGGESVFMDASSFPQSNNLGKGLGFPRVNLTTFTFVTQGASALKFPTGYDGMIVYNTATGMTPASGAGVQTMVRPGFYYFRNPGTVTGAASGQWVAISVIHGNGQPTGVSALGTLYMDDASGEMYKYTTSGWELMDGGSASADGDAWGVDGEDQTSDITRSGKVTVGDIGTVGTQHSAMMLRARSGIRVQHTNGFGFNICMGNPNNPNASTASTNLGVTNGGFQNLTSGTANTAIGDGTMVQLTTGAGNAALGRSAMWFNQTGNYNTALGAFSLVDATGSENSAVGAGALNALSSGNKNTALGYYAGFPYNGGELLSGDNNILIGWRSESSAQTVSNEVTLGNSDNNVYRMYASGWTTISDQRLKHNIEPIAVGLDFVNKLQPKQFVYNNAKNEETTLGFIAQEMQELVDDTPELKNSGLVTIMDEKKGILGVKTTDLIPVLTKAIQEQDEKIDALEEMVLKLEQELRELKEGKD